MGRFFNREALWTALVLFIVCIAASLLADVPTWAKALIAVGFPAVLHWPMVLLVQDKILLHYTNVCSYEQALRLAVQIRDSSWDRKSRQDAALNVAFVQMGLGDYDSAFQNLKTVVVSKDYPVTRCVVDAVTGYCLVQLGRNLDRAEELISASIRGLPKEGTFVCFLALLRLRQGKFEEAKVLLEKSLELEPDPSQPYPGERAYYMAVILAGLGELTTAKAKLQEAAAANKRARFSIMAAKALEEDKLDQLPAAMVFPEVSVNNPADKASLPSTGEAEAEKAEAAAPSAQENPVQNTQKENA